MKNRTPKHAFALLVALLALVAMPVAAFAQAPAVAARPAADSLTDTQRDGLLYMVEEEKLAHDVYAALGATWNLPIFANIARAEARHAEAVLRLIDGYGIENPAAGLPAGEFANADLQSLYTTLVARGSASLEDALAVGALIEETDIADLDEELGGDLPAAVRTVYTRLRAGSANHLRAFARQLEWATGAPYTPQALAATTYDTIVSASPGGAQAGTRGGRGGRP